MTSRRQAWTEVDTGAIRRNVERLHGLTPASCRMMAVVKADGYGHGAADVARAALDGGATWLGVATVDEALELRDAGYTVPILVLGEPPTDTAGLLVEHDIASTLASRAFAVALSAAAEHAGRQAAFHLKVDTGMHRIGVDAGSAGEFLTSLTGLAGLKLEGVFTHFATADIPNDWDFDTQMQRFSMAVKDIREAGFDTGIIHASNSAATILHPEAHLDMVRCGIAIYGLHPADSTRDAVMLEPAMRVVAKVSSVRRIPMGEGVSYGLVWRASGPTDVATLPLGYADGVHRVLSGKMQALIGGKPCQQVGRICMDQLMVEIPRGLTVAAGDEVVLVGTQGDESLSLDGLAEAAGTINYEMACGFALRLPRLVR